MSNANCSICLEQLQSPVSVPCGHLHCERCLVKHISSGQDAYKSKCPTCRSPFITSLPNLTYVPTKYHDFILPATRRVYFDTSQNDDLKKQIRALKARNESLEADKLRLIEKCEASFASVRSHALGEKNAVKRAQEAAKEVENARKMYEEMKAIFERQTYRATRDAPDSSLYTSLPPWHPVLRPLPPTRRPVAHGITKWPFSQVSRPIRRLVGDPSHSGESGIVLKRRRVSGRRSMSALEVDGTLDPGAQSALSSSAGPSTRDISCLLPAEERL